MAHKNPFMDIEAKVDKSLKDKDELWIEGFDNEAEDYDRETNDSQRTESYHSDEEEDDFNPTVGKRLLGIFDLVAAAEALPPVTRTPGVKEVKFNVSNQYCAHQYWFKICEDCENILASGPNMDSDVSLIKENHVITAPEPIKKKVKVIREVSQISKK